MTLAAGFLLAASLAAADHGDPEINEIVVFGDSLSDTGNVYLATSVPSPQFPVQIPASPQWFQGRWTNGLVWHEVLAGGLGVAPAAPSLLGGSNYAWGGAEFGPGLSAIGVPNVGTQILQFLAARQPVADQLFVIQAGNNDFIPPGTPAKPEAVIAHIEDHVRTLAEAGARHFLIPASDIRSNTPGLNSPLDQFLFGPGDNTEAVADVLDRSRRFSLLLRPHLVQLEKELDRALGGVTISQLDIALLGRVVSQGPQRFGIDDVSTPALTANFNPLCFCEGTVSTDADRHFFFDIVHPTATVHERYGELALLNVTWNMASAARQDVND